MTDTTKTLTGAEMRAALFPKLEQETASILGTQPLTTEIARRTVRVFLRFAAKMAVAYGMPANFFAGEAMEALKNEMEAAAPVAQEASPEAQEPEKKTLMN